MLCAGCHHPGQKCRKKITTISQVDTRISVIKPLHAKWVVQFYDYVRGNRDVVKSGWRKSKIIDAVERQSVIQNDPFL